MLTPLIGINVLHFFFFRLKNILFVHYMARHMQVKLNLMEHYCTALCAGLFFLSGQGTQTRECVNMLSLGLDLVDSSFKCHR